MAPAQGPQGVYQVSGSLVASAQRHAGRSRRWKSMGPILALERYLLSQISRDVSQRIWRLAVTPSSTGMDLAMVNQTSCEWGNIVTRILPVVNLKLKTQYIVIHPS